MSVPTQPIDLSSGKYHSYYLKAEKLRVVCCPNLLGNIYYLTLSFLEAFKIWFFGCDLIGTSYVHFKTTNIHDHDTLRLLILHKQLDFVAALNPLFVALKESYRANPYRNDFRFRSYI